MAVSRFLVMAYRDLARNGRRSILTALAVALGLVVVMAFASLLDGMVESMLNDNIRLSTGHLQLRNTNYENNEGSLHARDLLDNGDEVAREVETIAGVQSAAPVLWIGGLLSTAQESETIRIVGINPEDPFHAPVREGIVAGEYLRSDDRGQVLVGRLLAEQMGITVGQRISLAASDANGVGQEGVFTVAGLVDTGYPSIDHHRVLLPMAQAQAFSDVGDRFSSLILTLDDQENDAAVAATLEGPQTKVITWRDLNKLILESVENGMVFYYVIYGIVFVAVAVLIANTLLMSVFARAREIGILSSLGMKGREILLLFLIEGVLIGIFGVILGWIIGMGMISYLTFVGFSIPAETTTMVEGFAFGTTMKGKFAFDQFIVLSLLLLAVVALVSIFPAWYAARMEPVEALHAT
jgi:ABC-type lipoprotein release transport system permease subunit